MFVIDIDTAMLGAKAIGNIEAIKNIGAVMVDTSDIKEGIFAGFNPITDLIAGLSYPVAYIMMGTGVLVMITGNKQRGIQQMKTAGIGYITMQFLPSMMQVLSDVGGKIRG